MKTKLLLTSLLSFSFNLLTSQVPHGFNYQAIARDGSGNPIINATIKVKLSVLSDTTGFFLNGTGTYIWEEEQTNVKTNAFGLFIVVFGKPTATKIQGSSASFGAIDWAKPPLYIGTKIANPTDYKNLGSAQLWSVPYSMVSDSAKAFLQGSKLSVVSANDGATDALFEVKRKDGQTVFAVYPDAVNIYVPRTAKGVKGGFAIGGFDGSKIAPQDYFRVTPDSIRVYIDKTPVIGKGATKGGFAIGGFDQGKDGGGVQDLLTVSNDSIRIYIDKNPSTGKGATKGGFAIGGFDESKSTKIEFLRVTPDSIRAYIDTTNLGKGATKGGFAIGGFGDSKGLTSKYLSVNANKTNISVNDSTKGFSITNVQGGTSNDFLNINKLNYAIGHESGLKTNPNISATKGKYNVFFGYRAGFNNVEGYGNIFLGHESGYNTTIGSYNVYMGYLAGNANINGNSNVFVGYQSGKNSTAGWNVYVGEGAGSWNSTGTCNTYIGSQAGIEDGEYGTPGHDNVFIGYRAGALSYIGNDNVYIGSHAGELNNNSQSGRILIGSYAGYNDGNPNRLYIDNSATIPTVPPLIYGEFNSTVSSRQLTINGKTTTNGSFNYGPDTGSANTYLVAISGITAYVTGMVIIFKANTSNTGACTVNINSIGAKALRIKVNNDPGSGYIATGSMVMAVYDGTNFQMIQPAAN
jgi:hypothetical protein